MIGLERPNPQNGEVPNEPTDRPLGLVVLVSADTGWVLRRRAEAVSLGLRCAWRPLGEPVAVMRDASLVWLDLRTPGALDGLPGLRAHSDADILCFLPVHDPVRALEAMQRGAHRVFDLHCEWSSMAPVVMTLLQARNDKPERRIGRIVVDERAARVWVDERQLTLTPAEFHLLEVLSRRPGAVVTAEQLAREALAVSDAGSRALSVHMCNLRRKLGAAADHLKTVRGEGYLVEAPSAANSKGPSRSMIEGVLNALGTSFDAAHLALAPLHALLGMRRSLMVSALVETASKITPQQLNQARALLDRLSTVKHAPELFSDTELDLFAFLAGIVSRPMLVRLVEETAREAARSPWYREVIGRNAELAHLTYEQLYELVSNKEAHLRDRAESPLLSLDTAIVETRPHHGVAAHAERHA